MFGLLNQLVIPALGMQEEIMQDLGLQCLGLICALEQGLAQDNMDLFLTCVFAENATTHLRVLSLKVRATPWILVFCQDVVGGSSSHTLVRSICPIILDCV